MPDFLTRRNGMWHFVRRVPTEFVTADRRGVIRHSTKVRVATDRTGRRAARVAERLNAELESYWRQLVGDTFDDTVRGYDDARRRARSLGFEYLESDQILLLPLERRLERLEAVLSRNLQADAGARAASLDFVHRAGKRRAIALQTEFNVKCSPADRHNSARAAERFQCIRSTH
jgi:hypothetical protein